MLIRIKQEVPHSPGCYLYKNYKNEVIYVGKAKDLQNRMKSYFTKGNDTKTQSLVMNITDFDFKVVLNEKEALIFENNLIKKYQPKYNMVLKDDKNYPYLKLTKEEHPRLIKTRKVLNDGGKYYGPFTSKINADHLLEYINRHFELRKCNKIPKHECLYYHLGQCYAPCIQKINRQEIDEKIEKVNNFLNPTSKQLTILKNKMMDHSKKLEFEKADMYKKVITALENLSEIQVADLGNIKNMNAIAIKKIPGWIAITIIEIREGKLNNIDQNFISVYNNNDQEAINTYLFNFLNENKQLLIYDTLPIDSEINNIFVNLKVAKTQIEKNIMELAYKNLEIQLASNKETINRKFFKADNSLRELEDLINIPNLTRIEIFDNSNHQGSHIVSGMVVFIDGKPAKKEYRKYRIKTVFQNDDYHTMSEVIERRYHRVKNDNLAKPDLIIVDGGIQQINAAVDSLSKVGMIEIPIVGLVKNENHKTDSIILPETFEKVKLKRGTDLYFLLERMQEEAHNFTINYHRLISSKSLITSSLDNIQGIGPKTKIKIMKYFDTIDKVKKAELQNLKNSGLNEKQAKAIYEYYRKEKNETDSNN